MKQLFSNNYFSDHNIKNNLPPYLYAFFTPILLLSGINALNLSGLVQLLPFLVSFKTILFNGFAGICFLYYIKHTKRFSLPLHWQYVCSVTYSMCSYATLQEKHIPVLILYSVFPLLFYSYEKLIAFEASLPFLLFGSLAYILSPEAAIPVMLLLFILAIMEVSRSRNLSLSHLLRIAGCFLMCIIVSAFRVLSYLVPYYVNHSSNCYNGYSTTWDFFPFLSRFLPGTAPSGTFFLIENSIDLYFGLFFMIFFLFFPKTNPAEKPYPFPYFYCSAIIHNRIFACKIFIPFVYRSQKFIRKLWFSYRFLVSNPVMFFACLRRVDS